MCSSHRTLENEFEFKPYSFPECQYHFFSKPSGTLAHHSHSRYLILVSVVFFIGCEEACTSLNQPTYNNQETQELNY